LAAPKGSLRWEAAHVVRGLCTLRRERVLGRLVALATAAAGGPFADARLHFYDMHARQWLLIALSRSAEEDPDVLLPHADFLVQLALNGETHVLIRGFAAKAALTLIDSGLTGHHKAELRERLLAVNISPFPVVEPKRYERGCPQRTSTDGEGKQPTLHFGIDFGPYWLAPLADCFAKSRHDVELAVSDVITKEWRCSSKDGWIVDQRARLNIFREGETYDSHGSNPTTHDLHFYLSYHAMMVVAGRLLATVAVHRDRDYPEDDFYT
jgi:hypothetical protein